MKTKKQIKAKIAEIEKMLKGDIDSHGFANLAGFKSALEYVINI